MKRPLLFVLTAALLTGSAGAQQAPVRPDQQRFRELYKELVETNTTLSTGSCTLAAERMAARLKAAGYPDADLTLFSVPERPKEGGLVAILHGSDLAARPILLLAHLDVVEASGRIGRVIRSPSSRRTVFSTRAAFPTIRRRRRSGPTR